jgi:hypothetical protein
MHSSAVAAEVKSELEARSGASDQLELLPPTRFAPGSWEHGELVERIERARRGRPPGARNLATRDAIAFIRRLFGDPLVESARYLAHTPETLAAELHCTKLEAFNVLEKIRADLRTFIYPRMATVDSAGQAIPPTFNMIFAANGAPADSSGAKPWEMRGNAVPKYLQQNQPPSETEAEKSHAEKSHD